MEITPTDALDAANDEPDRAKGKYRMMGRLAAYLDSIRARDPGAAIRAPEILTVSGRLGAGPSTASRTRCTERRLFFLARAVNHLSRGHGRRSTSIPVRDDRTQLLHRPRLRRDRRDGGDRRRRHDLPVRDAGAGPARTMASPGKRHPTLCDDGVIIGSGAQVLGPITVGPGRAGRRKRGGDARRGRAGAVMVGIPARADDGGGRSGRSAGWASCAYGTPCSEMFDPADAEGRDAALRAGNDAQAAGRAACRTEAEDVSAAGGA